MAALTINAANVRASAAAQTDQGVAGQDILAGRPVFLNTVLSQYFLCNSVVSSNITGVAICSANTNQSFFFAKKDPNFAPGYTINAGNAAIVGNVAGQVNPFEDRATGWYVNMLGLGIGGGNINLQITGVNVAI